MPKAKPYTKLAKQLMAEKSAILSKAQAFADMGMAKVVEPLWASAATCEERLAPLIDALSRHTIVSARAWCVGEDWTHPTKFQTRGLTS